MNKLNILTKLSVNCFLFLFIGFNALAQKLPVIQQVSLLAPKNVKTDGKVTEWGELQAYNHSTDVYYSIANNDDKLYLTILAKDVNVIKKILNGGIDFTISPTGKKGDKDNMTVRFPILKGTQGTSIGIRLSEPGPATDSLVRLMNDDMETKTKEIKLTGFKQFADSSISVYNEVGIKAATHFNEKKEFGYELAIPLKYLGLSAKDQSKLHYNVILNGADQSMVVRHNTPGGGTVIVTDVPIGLSPTVNSGISFNFPTDFWGEYTLAK